VSLGGPRLAASRAAFGQTWWGRRWLEALERFGWEPRLRRGRTYARTGQVKSLEIKPGHVEARVKGSRPRPYVVRIDLPVVSDEGWERVLDLLVSQARFAADLLAGTMPPTIDEVFEVAGQALFPDPVEPLDTSCSCPDWAVPCKHVAAVQYVLGSELDRDPFLLFHLRGRTRDAVIAALRARRASTASTPAAGRAPKSAEAAGESDGAQDLERFWMLGQELAGLRFVVEPPRVPYSVLKRVGTPLPADDGRQLAELQRLYRTISDGAIEAAYESEE
jgi:uncharacterized Zn finger protein